jgi:hypothetical protein
MVQILNGNLKLYLYSMKDIRKYLVITAFAWSVAIVPGCKKPEDPAPNDYTVNLLTTRYWAGSASGNLTKDTIINAKKIKWPAPFSRTINDTFFAPRKVDNNSVSVHGATFVFRSIDQDTRTATFDVTLPGAARSVLTRYIENDSLTIEYHWTSPLDSLSGMYFFTDEYLHTQ